MKDENRERFYRGRANKRRSAQRNVPGMDTERCPASGKRGYPTKQVARSRAAQTQSGKDVKLRIYRCPYCRNWHMTSMTLRTNRAVAGPREG